MSDGQAILLSAASTAIGVILGGVPSWFWSRRYYLKSGPDLDAALRPIAGDNQKLLQATNALARMLEQAGIAHLTYDAAGNLTGIVVSGAVHATASFGETATATVLRGQPPQYDRQHEQPPAFEPEGDRA